MDDATPADSAVTCVRCGSDLSDSPPGSYCPGCGLAVEDSLDSTTLYHAEPRYLSRVVWGCGLVAASPALTAITAVGVGGLFYAAGAVAGDAGVMAAQWAGLLSTLAGQAAVALGLAWVAAEPEPAAALRRESIRRRARSLNLLQLLAALVAALVPGFALATLGQPTLGGGLPLLLVPFVNECLIVLAWPAGLLWAAEVAARLPARTLPILLRTTAGLLFAGLAGLMALRLANLAVLDPEASIVGLATDSPLAGDLLAIPLAVLTLLGLAASAVLLVTLAIRVWLRRPRRSNRGSGFAVEA